MHGFQNDFAQVLSKKSSSVIWNIGLGRLKVKVTLEGQMIIELVRAITSTFIHGFQNNFAQVFSLRSSSTVYNIFLSRLKVKVTL